MNLDSDDIKFTILVTSIILMKQFIPYITQFSKYSRNVTGSQVGVIASYNQFSVSGDMKVIEV